MSAPRRTSTSRRTDTLAQLVRRAGARGVALALAQAKGRVRDRLARHGPARAHRQRSDIYFSVAQAVALEQARPGDAFTTGDRRGKSLTAGVLDAGHRQPSDAYSRGRTGTSQSRSRRRHEVGEEPVEVARGRRGSGRTGRARRWPAARAPRRGPPRRVPVRRPAPTVPVTEVTPWSASSVGQRCARGERRHRRQTSWQDLGGTSPRLPRRRRPGRW